MSGPGVWRGTCRRLGHGGRTDIQRPGRAADTATGGAVSVLAHCVASGGSLHLSEPEPPTRRGSRFAGGSTWIRVKRSSESPCRVGALQKYEEQGRWVMCHGLQPGNPKGSIRYTVSAKLGGGAPPLCGERAGSSTWTESHNSGLPTS